MEALKTFNKAIDQVMKQPPGPKRWRAANDLWLSLSPANKELYVKVIKENQAKRESLKNKYGTSDDKLTSNVGQGTGFRNYMSWPTGAYYFIETADPMAFTKDENAKKLRKTFPEYATSESY